MLWARLNRGGLCGGVSWRRPVTTVTVHCNPIGYNCINGTNYGGMDEPLPQGARAAFLIAESEWQEVASSKGKRGRGS